MADRASRRTFEFGASESRQSSFVKRAVRTAHPLRTPSAAGASDAAVDSRGEVIGSWDGGSGDAHVERRDAVAPFDACEPWGRLRAVGLEL